MLVLFDYVLKSGFDEKKEIFITAATYLKKNAINRNKGLVGAGGSSGLFLIPVSSDPTQDTKYLTLFVKTCDFIDKHQVGWQNGEWYASIIPQGKPEGNKADQ